MVKTEQELRTAKQKATRKRNLESSGKQAQELRSARARARNAKIKLDNYIEGFEKGLEMAERIRRSQS